MISLDTLLLEAVNRSYRTFVVLDNSLIALEINEVGAVGENLLAIDEYGKRNLSLQQAYLAGALEEMEIVTALRFAF